MKNVLVTGGTGFVGSWLIKKLVSDGFNVKALVRKSSDLTEIQTTGCNYTYGDVTDYPSVIEATKNINYVFHLAAYIAYSESEKEKMHFININGTQNIINACKMNSIKRLVHMSSTVTIGASFDGKSILNEDSLYNLEHLNLGYFESKRISENLVIAAAKKNEVDAVVLNPSTIYGPGDAKKGSRKTQIQVAKGKFPFYTAGGVNVVDVEDVVNGLILGLYKGINGERYILSSENLLIKDLLCEIAYAAGVKEPKYLLPKGFLFLLGTVGDLIRPLGINSSFSREKVWTTTLYHWFSNHKSVSQLGFKARPAKISIEKSVKWMKENHII